MAPTFARHARLGRILTRCVGRLRAFDFDEFLPTVALDPEARFDFDWATYFAFEVSHVRGIRFFGLGLLYGR